MILYIAEKPLMAKAIAAGIGNGKYGNGCIRFDSNEQVVTWCFGHILEMYKPNDYDEKYQKWSMADLPILPENWKLKVKKNADAQFKVIQELVRQADYVVNAGDPDREGQLLIDEVLEYLGNKKPVKRILLNALDVVSVKEALANLKDNHNFAGLKKSALARSRADWLIGMILSWAYSILATNAGYQQIKVGRVKTPTMSLVVRREDEINHFKPVKHFQVLAVWQQQNGLLPSTWQMPEGLSCLDVQSHLLDKSVAESVLRKIQNSTGRIISVNKQRKNLAQRLPYSLSSLQIEAGKKYGYKPQQVLDAMQDLYEKKLTTYPRSDCDYLPENQFADARIILDNIKNLSSDLTSFAAQADANLKSRAWNDKKISAHHAIIPTTESVELSSLIEIEQNLYLMVARAYLAQFFSIHTYESTKIIIEAEQEKFAATGKIILHDGWKALYKNVEPTENEATLPDVAENDLVKFHAGKVLEKVTTPPARFTQTTLLQAMKEIYKYVKNSKLKDSLKECSGIGTEATRATIIDELVSGGLLVQDKKYLVPSKMAQEAVKFLPEMITYPDMTAIWEQSLDKIARGELQFEDFLLQQEELLRKLIAQAKNSSIRTNQAVPKCPNCHKPLVRRKGKNGFFWGCSGYPNCKTTLDDVKGMMKNNLG